MAASTRAMGEHERAIGRLRCIPQCKPAFALLLDCNPTLRRDKLVEQLFHFGFKDRLDALTAESSYAPFAKQVLKQGWVKPNRRIFDNSKISDHFAIIPTQQAPRHLSEAEAKDIEKAAQKEAEESADFAEASPYPEPETIFEDIYWEVDNKTTAGQTGRHFFND